MKREESTLITKKALAASLKKYMTKKTLKKITVSEIITDCNVNRKTFYYHFEDIYALLKWMLEQEAVEVVKQFDLLIDYKDAILFVIDYVETNAHILNCAYDSMGRDEMKRFFCNDFYEIIRRLIDDMEKSLHLNVPEDFKQFVCNLYMEALAGTLIDSFKNRGNNDREKMLKYLSLVLHTSLPETLKQAAATLD